MIPSPVSTSVSTRAASSAWPGTEVGWISRSESAHRARVSQRVQRRPAASWPVAVRASTSSQESSGVSAFQDGTSSVAPKSHSTSGDTQAVHS